MSEEQTIRERLDADQRRAFKDALAATEPKDLIEPSEGERRNGWTPETLTQYVHEQRAAQEMRVDPKSALRRATPPRHANSKYRPHRWRG